MCYLQITTSQWPNIILSGRNNSLKDHSSFIHTSRFLLHFLRTTQRWHKGTKLRSASIQFSRTTVTIGTIWLYLTRYCRKVLEVLAPPSLRNRDQNPIFLRAKTCHFQFLFYFHQDSLVNKMCRNSFEIIKIQW